jgi:probable O-glycosylation ligase (exosortase A-associated)
VRDLIIVSLVVLGSVLALRRPWIGALVWAWLSLMNPHRFAFGIAYDAPLAAMAAASTLVGLAVSTDRRSPFEARPAVLLTVFMVWMTLSWLAGLDPAGDYEHWKKVMKIDVMTLVTLAVVISRAQILWLTWVVAMSLALLGVKGGVFTVLNGGNYRVWGPPGTFIEDNNEFALALVMTIPLLRFLQQQVTVRWLRYGMSVTMMLCAAAALGSYSRGGFLAITAMGLVLWWRGNKRFMNGIIILIAAVILLAFMPDQWGQRMSSIESYEEDRSAMGRISAWWTAFNLAKVYPLGIGFELARPELFARFSPYPDMVHAAHSIYFLVLGNHGFIGLFLFLLLFGVTWRQAGVIRRMSKDKPEWLWCGQLASMCQVSLAGYSVGGAFLSLAYFDLPYYVMLLVAATLMWMRRSPAPDPHAHTKSKVINRLAQWCGVAEPASSASPGVAVTVGGARGGVGRTGAAGMSASGGSQMPKPASAARRGVQ